MHQRSRWIVGCCVFAALPAMADTAPMSGQPLSTTHITVQSATQLLDHQISRAARWGLDEIEWQRYQSLMQGIRSSVSPATLSPIEVLGIHARSADERRRYAEQWAVMMREDAERILAFQWAYDEAQRRLFPNGLLIDTSALAFGKPNQNPVEKLEWQSTDRVLFFTDTQCPTCDAVLERLISQLEQFSGIDLYLVGVSIGEEARIREWAASRNIDPAWVSKHKVTLNIDGGALGKVSVYTGQQGTTLPVLVLRRGDQLASLPASRF